MSKLTAKQEAFARAYVETGNGSEAYRRAYNAQNMKQETIAKKACGLLKQENVRGMVDQLREEAKRAFHVTTEQKMQLLWSVAETSAQRDLDTGKIINPNAVVAAVKELNAMQGDHAPVKSEVDAKVGVKNLIEEISERNGASRAVLPSLMK